MPRSISLLVTILALSWTAGCANLMEYPENASVVRCTQYNGSTGTPVSSVQAHGCQCMSVGDINAEIKMEFPSCEITLSP